MQSNVGMRRWDQPCPGVGVCPQVLAETFLHLLLAPYKPSATSAKLRQALPPSRPPSGLEGHVPRRELLVAVPVAVGCPDERHRGEAGCRHAKHTHFCVTTLQKVQLQPRLRHHENARGSRYQVLPKLTLLRQLLWKPDKKDMLDNIKILKCRARWYHPAGSSPPRRKCYWYHLHSASEDGSPRGSCITLCFSAHSALRRFPTNPRFVGGCHSPPPHFLGTSPQGKHRCWAPRLASAQPQQVAHAGTSLGRAAPITPLAAGSATEDHTSRDLLPLLVIQLSGCKMNRRRRMMEKGALPTLPAPGVHPLLQPLLFTQPVTPPHRVAVD